MEWRGQCWYKIGFPNSSLIYCSWFGVHVRNLADQLNPFISPKFTHQIQTMKQSMWGTRHTCSRSRPTLKHAPKPVSQNQQRCCCSMYSWWWSTSTLRICPVLSNMEAPTFAMLPYRLCESEKWAVQKIEASDRTWTKCGHQVKNNQCTRFLSSSVLQMFTNNVKSTPLIRFLTSATRD